MRTWRLLTMVIAVGVAGIERPAIAGYQTEIDRIVSRVGARTITRSDIDRARALRLVADVTSAATTELALENRLLALGEVSRLLSAMSVPDDALAARVASWETAMGQVDVRRRLMAEYEMSDADVLAWFRDDLRVEALLNRQFGGLAPAERARATAEWFERLRQRADVR